MNAHPFLNDLTSISAAASGALIAAIWQGTLLAAAVALVLQLARGITPAVRSLLWTGAFVLVVLLHLTPFLSLAVTPDTHAHHPSAFHIDARWSLAIAAVWLTLALFRLAQLAQSWVILHRIARSAHEIEGDAVSPHLLQSGSRHARLCISEQVDRPSVLGFFSPRVLLPAELYHQLSQAELEHIVLHEMEHLRRRDDWVNLLQKLALALFPLNPAMLWLERRLSLERELACDDHVLAQTRARKTYATCLVNLAEHSVLRRRLSLALGAWERRSELARRVLRILHQPQGEIMTTRRLRVVTAMLVAAMLGGTAELAREPRLVSFAPSLPLATQAEAIDRVVPNAASYMPATYREQGHHTQAVDAVFHLPSTPSSMVRPAIKIKPKASSPRRKPQALDASLRLPRQIAATEVAQSAPPAEMAIPESAAFRTRPARVLSAPQAGAVLVLTTWTEYSTGTPAGDPERRHTSTQTRQQIQLLVAHPISSSYAAIPTPDGWLILQL